MLRLGTGQVPKRSGASIDRWRKATSQKSHAAESASVASSLLSDGVRVACRSDALCPQFSMVYSPSKCSVISRMFERGRLRKEETSKDCADDQRALKRKRLDVMAHRQRKLHACGGQRVGNLAR